MARILLIMYAALKYSSIKYGIELPLVKKLVFLLLIAFQVLVRNAGVNAWSS